MKLKKHCDYKAEMPDGKIHRVTFICFAGKGHCKVVDHEDAARPYKIIPRFRINEHHRIESQQELFA